MVPNTVPQSFLAEFVAVWNGYGSHKAFVGLRTRGLLEHVLRRPIYELWATTLGAYPSVVEVGLELGHFVGVGVRGAGAGDAVVAGPEASVVQAVAPVGQGTFAGFLRTKPIKLGCVHEVLEVGLDGGVLDTS